MKPTGVLLLSFGSASGDADVPAYLARIRHGRAVPPELVEDLRMRYRRIGGSPLLTTTAEQAGALQRALDPGSTGAWLVRPAMLHSEPSIATAVNALVTDGVDSLVAIPMAPQWSPHSSLYGDAIAAAMPSSISVQMADPWHLDDGFIAMLGESVRGTLAGLDDALRADTEVVFTAHSLPVRVPGVGDYSAQVEATARAVAARLGLADARVVFQSRSGPAEEWLGPDILDVVASLPGIGRRAVVPVPVQFVADHLEVLYDLDVQVRELAGSLGLGYARPPSANARPEFIAILERVARTTAAPSRHAPALNSAAPPT